MENGGLVKSTQAPNNLNENAPNVFLFDIGLLFLVSSDFLEKVTVVCILHHDAKNEEYRKSRQKMMGWQK